MSSGEAAIRCFVSHPLPKTKACLNPFRSLRVQSARCAVWYLHFPHCSPFLACHVATLRAAPLCLPGAALPRIAPPLLLPRSAVFLHLFLAVNLPCSAASLHAAPPGLPGCPAPPPLAAVPLPVPASLVQLLLLFLVLLRFVFQLLTRYRCAHLGCVCSPSFFVVA